MAVWLAVIWALTLGLFTGGLAAGKKPHDWTLFLLIVILGVSQTIWTAVSATRKTT